MSQSKKIEGYYNTIEQRYLELGRQIESLNETKKKVSSHMPTPNLDKIINNTLEHFKDLENALKKMKLELDKTLLSKKSK
jgi:hypothetical protein